jgi:hypothetical protein
VAISDGLVIGALAAAGLVAALLLRSAWSVRTPARVWLILGGWLVVAGAGAVSVPLLGAARGVFIATMIVSVLGLAVVAANIRTRPAREAPDKTIALEPSDRASRAWRGWLRALLAGPIGGIAAIGVAVAWTVWLPTDAQTRIVTGGLLAPVLWGAGMAWTLSDDKILRATAVLVGVSVVTFALAAVKGFA